MDTCRHTPTRAAALYLAVVVLAVLLARPSSASASSILAADEPISTTVTYEPQGQLRLVGQAGGQLTAVAVDAGYAFIGEGQRVTSWAVGPDGPPRLLASTPLLGDLVSDIELLQVDDRRLAAVTISTAGLVILDLTDPGQPALLSRVKSAGSAQRVALGPRTGLQGFGLLYIIDNPKGLWVVDASDLRAPVDLGIRQTWSIAMNGLAVDGAALYTVYSYNGYDGGILLYDVSDPLSPKFVAGRDRDYPLMYAYDITLVKDGGHPYAYVADLVLDAAPGAGFKTVRQILELERHSDAWRKDGTRAYTIHAGHLMAYDVSDPANPVGLGGYPLIAGALAVDHGIAVVARSDGQIQAVDVSRFIVMGLANLLGGNLYRYVDEIVFLDDLALVAHRLPGDLGGRLTVFDIGDPAHPAVLSSSGASYTRLEASPKYAFLIREYNLAVLDLSQPKAPRPLATVQDDPFKEEYGYLEPNDVAALDHTMYVAARGGLAMYDLALPGGPAAKSLFPTAAEAAAIEVRSAAVAGETRTYAYLAEGPRFHVVDVTDPAMPVETGNLTTSASIADLDVVDGLAYVAVSGVGLQVVDVRTPAVPALMGSVGISSPRRVDVDERLSPDGQRLAYVATGDLIVVDVTDPATPWLLASFPHNWGVRDVAATWPYIYYADEWGLRILRLVDAPVGAVPLGRASTAGRVETVAAADGLVYSQARGGPLGVLDWDGTGPAHMLGQAAPGDYMIQAARRGFVYAVDGTGTAHWFDATDPEHIRHGGVFAGNTYHVALVEHGARAYLAVPQSSAWYPPDSQWNQVSLFEVTDGPPVLVGRYGSTVSSTATGVLPVVAGDGLYVDMPEGTLVFDMTSDQPMAKAVKVFDWSCWLATDGRYLYRGIGNGWEVYDVSVPAAPRLLATHVTPLAAYRLEFSAGLAWIGGDKDSIHILDLRDLSRPVERASLTVPQGWGDLAPAGRFAYVASAAQGVWAVEYLPGRAWLPVVAGGG